MRSWGKNNSGIILISVLWIVAILSLLALSLQRSSSLELSSMRNSTGRARAYAAASSGIVYARHLLAKKPTELNTLYNCGIASEAREKREDLFKAIPIGKGAFADIAYQQQLGLQDEMAKINLNNIGDHNLWMLSYLLQEEAAVPRGLADNIAAAVVDWRDEDSEAMSVESAQGAESEYYTALKIPYKPKNKSFESVEELMLVKDMTPAIFEKIKSSITVFPKGVKGQSQVNLLTASDAVIKAVVNGYAKNTVNGITDPQAVIRAVISRRNGVDNKPYTLDDGKALSSVQQEEDFNKINNLVGSNESKAYRARSIGRDEATGIRQVLEAVLVPDMNTGEWQVQSWRRY